MKIALTTKGKQWKDSMDPRFGRSEFFILYDEEKDEMTAIDNRAIKQEAHGAGPKTAQLLMEHTPDILITGNGPGGNAASVLERAAIDVYTGAGNLTAKEAYNQYKEGKLNKF